MTTTKTREMELKDALRERLEIMEGIVGDVEIDGENVEVKSRQAQNYRKALAEAEEIRDMLRGQSFATEMKAWLDGDDTGGAGVSGLTAVSGLQLVTGMEAKTLGELFTGSDEFKAFRTTGGLDMAKPWSLEGTADITAMIGGRKDVFTQSAPVQSTLGFGRTQFDPMVPRAMRTARVRDLFPVARTDANNIDYYRIVGFGTTRLDHSSNAKTVAERRAANGTDAPIGDNTDVFGLKPQSRLKFESANAVVRTIAHYEVAHRNVLADEPQLQSTINNELLYGLRLEEDRQIINGSGTGEDLVGILNTPNIQTYTQVGGETKADALRRAATKAALAYYSPTGYVLHPYDWEDIELTKTTQGAYILATNVAVGAQTQAWRQPVVESPAMPEGTFLTGAWGLGAQLYDREQANIRISEHHADFFARNAVAILAEERLALAVKRPESFVKGTFA